MDLLILSFVLKLWHRISRVFNFFLPNRTFKYYWTMSLLVREGVDLRSSWRGIDVCDRDGILVSVIIWWLNGSTQSRARRGTQTAYWWWLVTEAQHWLQPCVGWWWHFHPISTAYRHQRKQNFEICLHGEKEGEKPRGERKESVQSPFLINSFWDFICSNTHSATTHTVSG